MGTAAAGQSEPPEAIAHGILGTRQDAAGPWSGPGRSRPGASQDVLLWLGSAQESTRACRNGEPGPRVGRS
jgi:hypothetical protein